MADERKDLEEAKGEPGAALSRGLDRGKNAVAAMLGSNRAKGRLQLLNAMKALHKEFFTYAGQQQLAPTVKNIFDFCQKTYNVPLDLEALVRAARGEAPPAGTPETDNPQAAPAPATAGEPPKGETPQAPEVKSAEAPAAKAPEAKAAEPKVEVDAESTKLIASIRTLMAKSRPDKREVMQGVLQLIKLAKQGGADDKNSIADFLEELHHDYRNVWKVEELGKITPEMINKLRENVSRLIELTQILVEHDVKSAQLVTELSTMIFEDDAEAQEEETSGAPAQAQSDPENATLNRGQIDKVFNYIAQMMMKSGAVEFDGVQSGPQGGAGVAATQTSTSAPQRGTSSPAMKSTFNMETFNKLLGRSGITPQQIERAMAYAQTLRNSSDLSHVSQKLQSKDEALYAQLGIAAIMSCKIVF